MYPTRWKDYQLLDAGEGQKLEQWGPYLLQRPDPQALWGHGAWPRADAVYQRSKEGGGQWQANRLPAFWDIRYPSLAGELCFQISLMGFKHTGLFPEQAANWDFMQKTLMECKRRQPERKLRVLNLFAYSGAASLACAKAGADEVVHVDAAKKMNALAKVNQQKSGLDKAYIRFITEDVNRFVEREIRRGRTYDGILMDPPAYGRGPQGELWKLEEAVSPLLESCLQLLRKDSLFLLINAYTSSLTALSLQNLLKLHIQARLGGEVEAFELSLKAKQREIELPCGFTGRWLGQGLASEGRGAKTVSSTTGEAAK